MKLKIFKNVESNMVWFIKDGYYYDYKRLLWCVFYRYRKPYLATEN